MFRLGGYGGVVELTCKKTKEIAWPGRSWRLQLVVSKYAKREDEALLRVSYMGKAHSRSWRKPGYSDYRGQKTWGGIAAVRRQGGNEGV